MPFTSNFLIVGLQLFKNPTTIDLEPESGSGIIQQLDPSNTKIPKAELVFKDVPDKKDQLKSASRIITGFRLAAEGGIGYFYGKVIERKFHRMNRGLPYRCPKKMNWSYHLDDKIFKKIQDTVTNLGHIKEWKGDSILRFGLNRLNRSYDTTDTEDFLIDIITCLDSLYTVFQPRNPHQPRLPPKGILVGKRMDFFLGNDVELDSELQRDLKNRVELAYKIRNDIIHEGKWLNKKSNFATNSGYHYQNHLDFLFDIREYARRTLCRYIKIAQAGKDSFNTSELKQYIIDHTP